MAPWPLSIAFPLTLLAAIALILAVDAAAAWLTRERPAVYRRIWPVQFGIYVVIGFVAMLTLLDLRLVQVVGALTGLAESTAGWAITWRIGPGRIPNTNVLSIGVVVLSMTAFGFGFAIAGALLFNAVAGVMLRGHG
ncbi:MAG: hypothetical protein QOF71_2084 [Candidatus Eremiobacteraeota bacterium]|nr:hypothetical protein [Candidatus Eremiobacteraeota bacterium]